MSKRDFQHPFEIIDRETIEFIRRYAAEAEKLERLHPSQLEVIRNNRWLKMFIPQQYGGLGWSLPEVLRTEEALSYADGSTGWVITLCSGAGWFVGFVNAAIAQQFFSDDDVFLAGSGSVTGTAEETDSGYVVNGVWKYASGALHATAFTANCYLTKDGKTMVHEDGSDRIATFIFKHEEVTIYDTWRSMGMIATGSHSFEVKNLPVTRVRCFEILPSRPVINDPVYKFPFMQLAETTLAVNMSGMALRFVELAEMMTKERPTDYQRAVEAGRMLDESRKAFSDTVELSWRFLASEDISRTLAAELSDVSRRLVQTCREIVDSIYPICGLAAADYDSEINRIWRNFHTAGQHSLFRER